MRIAHVTNLVSNRADGVRAAIEQMSAAQALLGHTVSVTGLAARNRRDAARMRWAGAELHIAPHIGPLGFAPSLPAHLEALGPDIVHAHGLWWYPPYAAARRRDRTGMPLVISPHGMLNDFALSLSRWKKRIASFLYQDSVFRIASLFHVTSDKELREVRDYGLDQPVAIIPNGVISSDGGTGQPRSKTVLVLGRIHPIKGLDRLIAAWGKVEPHFPDWTLRVVGPDIGGHAGQLQDQARQLAIAHMRIEPPLYGVDKDVALAGASLFALPSLTENFAMTVAESLAAGTPAIVSTAAPWSSIVERGCGWWIDPDVDSLAATLHRAMALSDAERRAMGKRGQAWMGEAFGWDSIASRLVMTYDWLLDRSPRPDWIVTD